MFIGIWADTYGSLYVATRNNICEVMDDLKEQAGASSQYNFDPQDVDVYEGARVKVTREVTYTVNREG